LNIRHKPSLPLEGRTHAAQQPIQFVELLLFYLNQQSLSSVARICYHQRTNTRQDCRHAPLREDSSMTTPTPPPEPTPFEKFSSTMRKLMAVPKSEIVEEEKKYQRRKARRAKRKKGA
jgi:hypothetical protein